MQSDIATFQNIIDPSRYDNTQQNAKQSFRTSLRRQGQRMCLNILTGETAVIATTTLSVSQAVKLTLNEADSKYTTIGCPDGSCPSQISGPDYVKLGSTLKARYANPYTCGSDECLGLCMTSSQVERLYLYEMHNIENTQFSFAFNCIP